LGSIILKFSSLNIILFDTLRSHRSLLPLSYTRPTAEMRTGIMTIAEKWEAALKTKVSFLTINYLQKKYAPVYTEDNLYIKGVMCPNPAVLAEISSLKEDEVLVKGGWILACRTREKFGFGEIEKNVAGYKTIQSQATFNIIEASWDLFLKCRSEIEADFRVLTSGRESAPLSDPYTRVYGKENLFIEEGATVLASVINASEGPVYIGKNAQIQEGVLIRGALALGEGAHLNMGAKMRGDTTIGPYCKVGGEVSNSVLWGYSNKAHDGFLGNSVLGQWCNLGADTNTSNLKNNYSSVRIWNYLFEKEVDSRQIFCGLTMGDHSKSGINTMFNTGTVVGVSVNVYGGDFPPKFLPSFAWGSAGGGFSTFMLEKALEVASKVMGRRNLKLSEEDTAILEHIFEASKPYRENYILEL
jgi:UDP-N-acetylglucosamine diphosphorylase/glucosamine-1-phosphate N-acetyltransferase